MDPVPEEAHTYRSASPTTRSDNVNNHHAYDRGSAQANGYDSPTALSQKDVDQDWSLRNSHNALQNSLSQVYELSEDRRKKRKISQEPVISPETLSPLRADRTIKVHEVTPSNQQHELSDSKLVEKEQAMRRNSAEPDKSIHLVAPAPAPAQRRRGRPPKAAGKDVQTTLSACSASNNVQTVDSPSNASRPKTSPRRATLKIGADGKLFESSKSPPTDKPSKTSKAKIPTKSALGGKNLVVKNGRLARKLVVTLRYQTSPLDGNLTGTKIDEILSQKPRESWPPVSSSTLEATTTQVRSTPKSTHPFFLAKAAQQQLSSSENTSPLPGNPDVETKKPVAWKDLGFKPNRASGSKDVNPEMSIWPPLQYHHVGATQRLSKPSSYERSIRSKHKSKAAMNHIAEDENILSSYTRKDINAEILTDGAMPCDKLLCTGANLLMQVPRKMELHHNVKALSTMRKKMLECSSAFDRAEASGPHPWTQQYSPSNWEEVLQSTSYTLFEWLSRLAVHNVKQGLDSKQSKQAPKRRRRPKKRNDEFADFIDFDDEPEDTTKMKNAILLVGPHGCGKTASVFTIAKQLGFEVFEIHSGMRRSQKDIFEKVGDMTQNHMVQAGQNASRDSSVLHDTGLVSSQDETTQPSLTSFLAPPSKKSLFDTSRSNTPQPNKQSQKQSLILFEEIDHVFEDDRGFWSGVQALIQNSKRPVVLTCNDTRNVPLNELDLYTTLVYTSPRPDVVAEYLCYMAAAEGHVIQPDAIQSLYVSKGYDLRATITELQFWCQMTVGSAQGGLDWFPPHKSRTSVNIVPSVRTFSVDTFRAGLDMLPVSFLDVEEDLKFASLSLDIPCDALLDLNLGGGAESAFRSASTQQALNFMEIRSDAECMHLDAQPVLYSALAAVTDCVAKDIDRSRVTEAKIRYDALQGSETLALAAFDCLDALAVENSIHSLGHTRLAPSLDSPRSVLACDIAPYVRSTVSYDQRLEQQRDEAFSSQGKKSRTTRAARAAAEGGDKASTRRERWFPESLNLQAVLGTGNNWPQWPTRDDADFVTEMDVTSEA